MKELFYRFASSRWIAKLLSILAFAALGFIYSSGATAAVVLRGIDGGSTANDGKFVWNGTCINTLTKSTIACTGTTAGNAPTIGYLYKGPDSAGRFNRTGTCWNRSPLSNKEVACSSATGFISSSFSHSGFRIEGGGIEGGDITVILGDIDPNNQLISVVPGAVGTPTVVTISMPDVLVKGFATDTEPDTFVGQARFSFEVVFTIPIATSDPNKGGGNETCGKCDPNNPKKGASCTGCSVNQTCTNLSGGESQFTVKAFCQQGVTVGGELKLLKLQDLVPPEPPQATPTNFPGCTGPDTCTLQVGGLPLTSKGTVDETACGQIFDLLNVGGDPTKQLAQKQMLSFQQNYVGQCKSATLADFGLESSVGTKLGLHRECHSDSFDGEKRGCFVEDNAFHVVEGGEAARFIEVTIDLQPESVNLKCDAGKDSGISSVSICTTHEFNALDIDTADLPFLIVEGDTGCSGMPCPVEAKSFGQANTCGDSSQDVRIVYPTCTATERGLADAITRAKGSIPAGTLVPVTLQGTAGNGTVIIQGTDEAKVVNPQ